MFIKVTFVVFTFCLSLLVLGCGQETTAPEKAAKSIVSVSNASAADSNESDVIKIVFVGQKQACECTRKRVDTTWKNLQGVISTRKDLLVEKIQLDVDQEQADKLDDLRSLIVAPGIYFFDKNEQLLEMLQGEVTSEQILKVL